MTEEKVKKQTILLFDLFEYFSIRFKIWNRAKEGYNNLFVKKEDLSILCKALLENKGFKISKTYIKDIHSDHLIINIYW